MLFDFQNQFVSDIAASLRKGNRKVLCQMPTGGGKSFCMAEIIRRSVLKGNVPLIACHRKEIFQQLYKSLKKFGVSPGLIQQGVHPMAGHPCYLGMVETVCRRMSKGIIDRLNINFLICDEAHIGNYVKLVLGAPKLFLLGFTATPKSTGNPELKKIYDDMVMSIPKSELIRIGRLVPARTISINHDFSKIKMKGRDFDDKSLFAEFKKPRLWDGAIERYQEHSAGKKFLWYCDNIEKSLDVTRKLRDLGYAVAHVDADTKDRDLIFKMHKEDRLLGVVNVGIATVGYDDPSVKCIVQDFATASIVKHEQITGRGGRADEGKESFDVIDMGRNWSRFGCFGEDVDWMAIYNNPDLGTKKDSAKQKSKRECDECGMVIKFNTNICPYCHHIITKQELEEKLLEGATLTEIREYRHQTLPVHLRKHPSELWSQDDVSGSMKKLREFARVMGYKSSWPHVMAQVFSKSRK